MPQNHNICMISEKMSFGIEQMGGLDLKFFEVLIIASFSIDYVCGNEELSVVQNVLDR